MSNIKVIVTAVLNRKFHTYFRPLRIGTNASFWANVKFTYGQFRLLFFFWGGGGGRGGLNLCSNFYKFIVLTCEELVRFFSDVKIAGIGKTFRKCEESVPNPHTSKGSVPNPHICK